MNMLCDMRLVVVGAGNIGRILIGRLQAAGVPARQITVCDSNLECQSAAAATFGVKATGLGEAIDSADILLLAASPKANIEILQTVGTRLTASQIVISFAAAVPLQKLEALVAEGVAVARIMPNAPSKVGVGMNPVAYGKSVEPAAKTLIEELLAALGESVEVRDDRMNWCVGLSGAAMRSLLPALEGMTQAGIEAGLAPEAARRVAAQVMFGTAALVQQTNLPFDEIKALTPMETVNEKELAQTFLAAAQEAKRKIDRLEEKL